jgi:hypothetical protein
MSCPGWRDPGAVKVPALRLERRRLKARADCARAAGHSSLEVPTVVDGMRWAACLAAGFELLAAFVEGVGSCRW